MFQHPTLAAQFAADHRVARRSDASRRRVRRAAASAADRYEPDVGERVAAAGIDHVPAEVAAVVRVARRRGIGASLAAIVADPTAPAVARERALGRLLARLAAGDESGTAARRAEPAA